ncbi:MAG: tetratricopeptide repeat protein [Candidatus Acidiferrales bacterium]
MAFNKSKALENALKFLNQGKPAQAIAEYQLILRADPKDQATLMTVGDLFARQGDMGQAIEYFERLAQVYLNDGFNSKAIAIYKKIAKLAPNELAPLERLADLYVQQGVLSEARPLFLQIAEAHLKANHASKAVEVLHRLLEVEPENSRVQMRLAELYNVMGQKKESSETYLSYAQRLYDHGETDEARKLIDRAVEVDPSNAAAHLLKAKILNAGNQGPEAIAALASHPDAEAGGDVTKMLVDLELRTGQPQKAAEIARRQLARGHEHYGLLYHVAETLIESGQTDEAFPLLGELRNPMIEAGEQDRFVKALTSASERMPGRIEPLEMLVDFCRTISDPFRLNSALSQLADAYESAGDFPRAEQMLEEIVDRNKNDERIQDRLAQFRARTGGGTPVAVPSHQLSPDSSASIMEERGEAEASAPLPIIEEQFDEETQRYIAQALTDVDLFSSYGLTQKATHLLENVLQRAPRHTPTLERLLDLYLGAGNERRTAELAGQLEQIHRERRDNVNAERFAELRQRFQKAAGITEAELPAAPPIAARPPAAISSAQASVTETLTSPVFEVAPAPVPPPPPAAAALPPQEFEIPLIAHETETDEVAAAPPVAPVPREAAMPSILESEPGPPPTPEPVHTSAEVDLSDEWDAISQEIAAAPSQPDPEPEQKPIHAEEAAFATEAQPAPVEDLFEEISLEPDAAVPVESEEPKPAPAAPVESESTFEIVEEPAPTAAAEVPVAESGEFELELTPEPARMQSHSGDKTTDDFINELVAEIDGLDAPASRVDAPTVTTKPAAVAGAAAVPATPIAAPPSTTPAPAIAAELPVPQATAESLNQLAEVFQEFRSELGEMGDEDEDLETHYNLGIAYREMGLLDEAIGEFQRVAKAVQKGAPFAYAMNCSTFLALSFMDKGEAKVASVWYQRALEIPGLDEEAILALRYDLGVSLETAGEATAALDTFRQVYAINIDYRDVADRIAALQKH